MKIRHLHRWDVSPTEAIRIQEALRGRLDVREYRGVIETVAGVDVSYDKRSPTVYAAVIVMRLRGKRYPQLRSAVRTRSTDSRTARSGRPTMVVRGRLARLRSASISQSAASMPCRMKLCTRLITGGSLTET